MTLRYLPLLLVLLTGPAMAEKTDSTYNRINLTVSAGEEIDNDTLGATLFAQQEGSDPGTLGDRVNRAIRQGVETARQQPGVKVQTLDYQTHPIYHNGAQSGWRVRQSIRLESQDATAISQLLGKLQPQLSIGSIDYCVSPEQRQRVEERLISEAIRQFRARAILVSKEMGHSDYRLVQMNISQNGISPRPYPMQAMALRAESAPTLEAGTQRVEVQINGTIELWGQ